MHCSGTEKNLTVCSHGVINIVLGVCDQSKLAGVFCPCKSAFNRVLINNHNIVASVDSRSCNYVFFKLEVVTAKKVRFVFQTFSVTYMDEVKEELKCATIMFGGQCVMMVGITMML